MSHTEAIFQFQRNIPITGGGTTSGMNSRPQVYLMLSATAGLFVGVKSAVNLYPAWAMHPIIAVATKCAVQQGTSQSVSQGTLSVTLCTQPFNLGMLRREHMRRVVVLAVEGHVAHDPAAANAHLFAVSLVVVSLSKNVQRHPLGAIPFHVGKSISHGGPPRNGHDGATTSDYESEQAAHETYGGDRQYRLIRTQPRRASL